jgi:hypothetical protein
MTASTWQVIAGPARQRARDPGTRPVSYPIDAIARLALA